MIMNFRYLLIKKFFQKKIGLLLTTSIVIILGTKTTSVIISSLNWTIVYKIIFEFCTATIYNLNPKLFDVTIEILKILGVVFESYRLDQLDWLFLMILSLVRVQLN